MAYTVGGGGKIYFSHGTNKARGSAILLSRKLKGNVKEVKYDENGRIVIISLQMVHRIYTIASIYAPNEDDVRFMIYAFTMVDQMGNDLKIIADFNTVLDLKLDIKGGKGYSNEKTRKFINEFLRQNELLDIWRFDHPDIFRSTFTSKRPVILQERLD